MFPVADPGEKAHLPGEGTEFKPECVVDTATTLKTHLSCSQLLFSTNRALVNSLLLLLLLVLLLLLESLGNDDSVLILEHL